MRIVRTFEPFLEPTIQGMNHQERAHICNKGGEEPSLAYLSAKGGPETDRGESCGMPIGQVLGP